jgi:hypothetical protein
MGRRSNTRKQCNNSRSSRIKILLINVFSTKKSIQREDSNLGFHGRRYSTQNPGNMLEFFQRGIIGATVSKNGVAKTPDTVGT